MGLASFLNQLFEHGRVIVPPFDVAIEQDDVVAMRAALVEAETIWRNQIPHKAPLFDLDAAQWAATQFFHACRFVVYREEPEEAIRKKLSEPCPVSPTSGGASTHYSVDVTYRFLPDLIKLATRQAEGDPLIERLCQWARDWPLSSVGVREIEIESVDDFASDACLLALYADRVIAHHDISRLNDPRVRDAVAAAIGVHDELAPRMAAVLKEKV